MIHRDSALRVLLFLLDRKGVGSEEGVYKALGISPSRAKMLLRNDKTVTDEEIIHYTASLILYGLIETEA